MRSSSEVIRSLLVIAALIYMVGCTRPQTAAREESTPPSVPPRISQEMLNSLLRQNGPKSPGTKLWAHKVRHRRETLFSIAQWYTGSGDHWPQLIKANPNIDPKRIHVGDTVLIPEDLLITRRPMPASIEKPKHKSRKIKKPRVPSAAPPAKKEETILYGPIENDLRPGNPEKNQLPVPLETID
jgi:LysM domain